MTVTNKRVGLAGIAKLFGVSLSYMSFAKPYLEGFPATKAVGKKKLYSLSEVKDWAEGKDVKALIFEAAGKRKRGEIEAQDEISQLLNLSRRLHAGEFAPARQRQSIAFRRMSAKVRNPQTTHVSIRPDWAL